MWSRALLEKLIAAQEALCNILKLLVFTMRSWPPAQPQSWRTTPCQVAATAYSAYLQLLSISGDCFLYLRP